MTHNESINLKCLNFLLIRKIRRYYWD